MKRVFLPIIFLVLIVGPLFAQNLEPVELVYKEVVDQFYVDILGPNGDAIQSWKDGIAEEWSFKFEGLTYLLNYITQKSFSDEIIMVGVDIYVSCYAFDANGKKVTVKSARGIVFAIDKETKKIIEFKEISKTGFRIIDGWGETSI